MRIKMKSEELYSFVSAGNSYREEGLINVMDDGVLLRLHEHSNHALYSGYIPMGAMEDFEPGEYSRLGFRLDKIKDFLPNNSDDVVIETNTEAANNKLRINQGNRKYDIPMIAPDAVNGVPDQVPELDHAIKVTKSFDFIQDFISDYGKMVSDVNNGSIWFSAREDRFILWGVKDNYEMKDTFRWDNDFDSFEIRWDAGSSSSDAYYNPAEDKVAESVINTGYINDMEVGVDSVDVFLDNYYPMKVVADWESGMKQSWVIPPRVPTSDGVKKVPDRVVQ